MATRTTAIQPGDLGFFSALVTGGSLSATARELGVTTAAVSKRLSQMEARLGVPLLNRTTRRMSLTAAGELYLEQARKILGDIDNMAELLGLSKSTPARATSRPTGACCAHRPLISPGTGSRR